MGEESHKGSDVENGNPGVDARAELFRGKSPEEVISILVSNGYSAESARTIVVQARKSLENPEVYQSTKEYVAKIDFLESLRDHWLTLLSDDNDVSEPEILDTDNQAETISPEERVAKFVIQVIAINDLMRIPQSRTASILSEFGLSDIQAKNLFDGIIEQRKSMSDGERGLEEVNYRITRQVIEQDLSKGKSDTAIIRKVIKSGWQEETARYLIGVIKEDVIRTEVSHQAMEATQSEVQRVMYYGMNLILPPDPRWDDLSPDEKAQMRDMQKAFQEWRNNAVLFGLVLYGLLVPFMPFYTATLLSILVVAISTIGLVSWFHKGLGKIFSRTKYLIFVGALLFAGVGGYIKNIGLFSVLGGFILVFLIGHITSLILRQVVWSIKA